LIEAASLTAFAGGPFGAAAGPSKNTAAAMVAAKSAGPGANIVSEWCISRGCTRPLATANGTRRTLWAALVLQASMIAAKSRRKPAGGSPNATTSRVPGLIATA
jgi:hypothetical protein